MKKTLTILLFAVLVMVLFPVAVLADGYDGSGGVIIDTAPATDLQTSVEALTASANVTNLTITIPSAANYALSGADQTYMSTSLTNLQTLDIADTVSFDADGNGPLGDVMNGFLGNRSTLLSVSLPSATAFGTFAFADCTSLTNVTLPSATTFGNSAFAGCTLLSSISLPSATAFGDAAFGSCTSLTSVSLPLATTFGNAAFDSCTSLASIDLPSAATFDNWAFANCSSLTSVSLPSATTFGNSAFAPCTLLSSISLPSATTFGDNAFSNCTSLTNVSLSSLTTLGIFAFSNCTQPIELTLGSTVPTVGFSAFGYGFPTGAIVQVPDTVYNAYDNDPQDISGTSGDDMWLNWPMKIYAAPVVTPEPAVNPQTGDSQSAYLWLLMLVAVGFVSALFIRKRRLSR